MYFVVEAGLGDCLGDRERLFNHVNRIHQHDLILEHCRLISQSHRCGNRVMELPTVQQQTFIERFCLLRITTIDVERDERNE